MIKIFVLPTFQEMFNKNIFLFKGLNRVLAETEKSGLIYDAEVDTVAAYDDDSQTLRVMAYNFKNDVDYGKTADIKLNINLPQSDVKKVRVTSYVIDDSCNYFDEWVEDRKTYGIGDDCFSWSPDDPQIESGVTLENEEARKIYYENLRDKYEKCSQLVPCETVMTVENSTLTIETELAPNGVVFYEITPCE